MEPFRSIVRIVALAAAIGVTAAASADWPMFQGSPQLLGAVTNPLELPLSLRWSHRTGGPIVSGPAISAGTVFVGSKSGEILALGLSDGKLLWTFRAGDAVEATPLVLGRRVIVGSADGTCYGLDRGTGAVLWKYATGGKIAGSAIPFECPGSSGGHARPAVAFGSYDNRLHAIDPESGLVLWTADAGNYVNGAPAVEGARIVFGGCDGLLHVVSTDGRARSEISAGAYIPGSPALSGARAYAGQFGGVVVCADVAAGVLVWTSAVHGASFASSPALARNRLVIGSRDRGLNAFDATTGRRLWTFRARAAFDGAPVVCGETVFAGSDDGRLYAIGLADGRELWSYDAGAALSGALAVSDGMLVFGAEDGTVYALAGDQRRDPRP